MIQGVFRPAIGKFAIFVFNQHVGLGDREGSFRIHGSYDLERCDVKFVPSICSFICPNEAGKDHTVSMRAPLRASNISGPNVSFYQRIGWFRRVAQNDEADVVVSTCAFNPAFEFHRLVGVLTFLHIAYPRGLDHALTKETQSPCLCECLP